MNEYTNSGSMRVISWIQKYLADNIEALSWVSRDGLLDMRKLKHFLSHACSKSPLILHDDTKNGFIGDYACSHAVPLSWHAFEFPGLVFIGLFRDVLFLSWFSR